MKKIFTLLFIGMMANTSLSFADQIKGDSTSAIELFNVSKPIYYGNKPKADTEGDSTSFNILGGGSVSIHHSDGNIEQNTTIIHRGDSTNFYGFGSSVSIR